MHDDDGGMQWWSESGMQQLWEQENVMKFERAKRSKAKLRLAISGPSGSGKTLSALLLAQGLGGSIAVIDTERDRASLYSDEVNLPSGKTIKMPPFDVLRLSPPYTPERYIEAIGKAESSGYAVIIVDSLTHEWEGSGGCLELVDEIARAKYRGNSWSAWSDVTPRHRALIDRILQSSSHIITTLRSKTETAQQEGPNGKKIVVKLGMKAIQRDGYEYEMTAFLDLSHDGHYATAVKDCTGIFMGRDPEVITPATGEKLLAWLESGADVPLPVLPALSEGVVADYEAAIITASADDLRPTYIAAVTAARKANDKAAEEAFTRAKDARKEQLANGVNAVAAIPANKAMDESVVADHLLSIDAASSHDELGAAYTFAVESARLVNDANAEFRFERARLDRKDELFAAAASQTGGRP